MKSPAYGVVALRLLLIGGVGFIGVNLAKAAAEQGVEVCIASRRSSLEKRMLYARLLFELNVPLYTADVLLGAVKAAFAACKPDCMVYLVGVLRGGRVAWEAHVELWSRILEKYGPHVSHLVYYSAAVVTPCKPIRDVTEAHPARVDARDDYTLSKREGELAALQAARRGISVSILRPVFVYGPYALHPEHRLFATLLRLRLRLGLPVDAIPVSDVASITLWLCNSRQSGKWFYAARPEGHTVRDLFETLCRGRKCIDIGRIAGIAARAAASISPRLSMLAKWLRCRWRFRPWGLEEFRRWTPIEKAVREYKAWLSRL